MSALFDMFWAAGPRGTARRWLSSVGVGPARPQTRGYVSGQPVFKTSSCLTFQLAIYDSLHNHGAQYNQSQVPVIFLRAPSKLSEAFATLLNMATNKSTNKAGNNNWISQKVQGYVSGAGNYFGGSIQNVGNGVNGVGKGIGDSITAATRGWGQGVAGYGNDIKDAARAGGPRAQTAGNPLGLSGAGSSKNLLKGGQVSQATKNNVRAGTRTGTAKDPLGLNR
ncbi:hypothetical protein K461DRAFT_291581 [Myriangium duriaei CBS 260.36]|uniref:Uncharacterized protein n=1 Tax=Myriangium duriaei CBS 260.36 TaxID=1168546 RepID=A0A9P4J999_9PEZI|nr:hypothetical protein K461DRAFT_291581 [Myriangium duriaei CBS 260.36]